MTIFYSENVRLELDLKLTVGECPLWSVAEQALYFVDIVGKKIFRFDPATQNLQKWDAPEEPGCIALMPQQKLMVALRSGFAPFDTKSHKWGEILKIDHDTKQFRFNDGRCDAIGRFWAATMFEPRTDALAALYCLERGHIHRILGPENDQGVKVGNGLAFDGKNGFFYRADTPNHTIFRHKFDVAHRQLEKAEIFYRAKDNRQDQDYQGRPDGAAIDSEGYYWSAQFEGGRILRFDPKGVICGEIRVPARRTTMLAFGGRDLRRLYITTAREGASPEELAKYPLSGAVFSIEVPFSGLPEPEYLE
ncbi:MAG: SMP-30/gluconolactonase/LRE family protein [Alphaproteobacteria bacterium]|nr:SMP-30/gluconolactonase/LRE family protein [Alphaproteobacteria bacterium]